MKHQQRKIMQGSIIVAFIIAFVLPGTALLVNNNTLEAVTYEQARELILTEKAILLDVQDEISADTISGALPIQISDLSCNQCLKNILADFEIIIVYSTEIENIDETINILTEQGFIVLPLNGDPDDFSEGMYDTACENLKPPAGKCYVGQHGQKDCIQNNQIACSWVCVCNGASCEWKLPLKCKSNTCGINGECTKVIIKENKYLLIE